MFYCPNCNNSLSITQQGQTNTQPNPDDLSETPTTVSSSSQEPPRDPRSVRMPITGNKAYFKCSNCGYNQEVEPGALILSRAPEKTTSDFMIDQSKYKDMIHDMTLPHTRNYICPNNLCKSHDDYSLREAVWFKPSRFSYTIINICKACETVW